jgi:hypothetical protein
LVGQTQCLAPGCGDQRLVVRSEVLRNPLQFDVSLRNG